MAGPARGRSPVARARRTRGDPLRAARPSGRIGDGGCFSRSDSGYARRSTGVTRRDETRLVHDRRLDDRTRASHVDRTDSGGGARALRSAMGVHRPRRAVGAARGERSAPCTTELRAEEPHDARGPARRAARRGSCWGTHGVLCGLDACYGGLRGRRSVDRLPASRVDRRADRQAEHAGRGRARQRGEPPRRRARRREPPRAALGNREPHTALRGRGQAHASA